MSGKRTCDELGLLVGAGGVVPTDRRVAWEAGTTRVGCSRLKCRHCGRRVRRITGYRIDRWPTTEDEIGEVWAAVDDPSACRFLTTAASGAEFSTYVCRCAVFDVSGIRSLRDIDTLDGWRCDGHPA